MSQCSTCRRYRTAQVNRFTCSEREARVFEDLEKKIEHERMRLFHFVEKQRPAPDTMQHPSEEARIGGVFVEQAVHRFLQLVFRHVEADGLSHRIDMRVGLTALVNRRIWLVDWHALEPYWAKHWQYELLKDERISDAFDLWFSKKGRRRNPNLQRG